MRTDLATLESIHHEHAFGWAFENLDVFLTGRNRLDREGLDAKLNGRRRGGWCFELNEWLALHLEDAGFALRRLMARNAYVPHRPRTHQISLVEAEGQLWIVDAGFGAQTPRIPMRLEDGFERSHEELAFRVARIPAGALSEPEAWMMQMRVEGDWRSLYRFTLESATAADFEVANHFHLTNPTSTFPDARMVTKPMAGGRLSLVDRRLKTTRNTPSGEALESEVELASEAQYGEVLADRFGLELSSAAIHRLFALEPSISRGSAPLA